METYLLSRDGTPIMTGTEGECWRYLHSVQSQSVDWALKYEGYTLEEVKHGKL